MIKEIILGILFCVFFFLTIFIIVIESNIVSECDTSNTPKECYDYCMSKKSIIFEEVSCLNKAIDVKQRLEIKRDLGLQ